MSEDHATDTQALDEKANKAERRKRRRRRVGYWLWGSAKMLVLLVAAGLVVFAMSGKSIRAPDWMQTRILNQLNAVVSDGDVAFEAIGLHFEKGLKPTITVKGLVLRNAKDAVIARVAIASASLSPKALIQGEIRPTDLRLDQASVTLQRARNGQFDLGFGVDVTGDSPDVTVSETKTLGQLLDGIDKAFETPVLGTIETVELTHLILNFSDARARRGWLLTEGRMQMQQDAEKVAISVGFTLNYGAAQPATIALNFDTQKGTTVAGFGIKVDQVAARDLASQIPALAWLGVLDAPISGAMRAKIGEDGLLGQMDGTLEIGQGSLQPNEEARAIAFESGRAYFGYDPKTQRIRFDELSVQTGAGKLVVEGQGYLRDMVNGVPAVMLGQFQIQELSVNPEDVFAAPVAFAGGALDMRLRIDPFKLDIGQAVLRDGDNSYLVKGLVTADNAGWHLAMDASVDAITPERLVGLWPIKVVPNTREWIDENVNSAEIFNVNGAIRVNSGEKPVFGLGFEFRNANVRYMKHLPVVENGAGHGTIANNALTVVVDNGNVTAPEGGVMDATGTVFQIPDINIKGPPAVIYLKAQGPVQAAMSLLDQKPFNIMSKAGQPVDLATGRVALEAEIHLRLVKKIEVEDVDYDVSATLTNVRSDKLVAGRVLTAKELALVANPQDVDISGEGFLGKVPVQGAWHQKLGKEFAGQSRVEGTVELSQRFIDEFSIGLPKGSVTGAGRGQIGIDLRRGEDSKFRLVSDLANVGLRIRDLGWSLPKSRKGNLEVVGTLGTPPRIDKLVIEGAGLQAVGSVKMTPAGDLEIAKFSRVKLAGWLDAPVELIGRGRGATPSVRLTGGVVDTRKAAFGSGGGGSGGAGAGGTLTVALDRLIVSEGITLTGFRGTFTRRNGFSGDYTARVNGKAPISGIVVPSKGGSAFRIKSKDAGAVFRAAGVLETVREGTMDLTLVPRKGYEGQYDGVLEGKSIKIRGAPAMADLLSAISGVGLLEQLNGKGILFTDYRARFRLTPTQVIILSSSAVGASMGVSMDGFYNLGSSTLDMQGVISPVYFVNGIGRIFTRKGEGLFGFNYRMTGKASDPKITVNPLSILTPGMFREIFKRPPPKVAQ
ncbi:YhdP family protein [Profundibacter sp.]